MCKKKLIAPSFLFKIQIYKNTKGRKYKVKQFVNVVLAAVSLMKQGQCYYF